MAKSSGRPGTTKLDIASDRFRCEVHRPGLWKRSLKKSRRLGASRIDNSIRKLIARGHLTISKDVIRSIALSCGSSICQVRASWKRLGVALYIQ